MSERKQDRIREATARIIAENRRALLGFAHYDRGEKVPGCDCCYCASVSPASEEGTDR
jgi:hypothetical protein